MNGGAHGTETKDVLVSCRAVDRQGRIHPLDLADMNYTYRHCGAADDLIFTEALFQGEPGEKAPSWKRWKRWPPTARRSSRSRHGPAAQRSRTRRATAPGSWWMPRACAASASAACTCRKALQLPDQRRRCAGEDVETLGETVRARVKAQSGVQLDWEIIRLGVPLPGHTLGEALAM